MNPPRQTARLLVIGALALAVPAAPGSAEPGARTQVPACVKGEWAVVSSPKMPEVRHQTEHFAFRWKGAVATLADTAAAGEHLEHVWRFFMGSVGFREPYCSSSTKFKANVHLDPGFGLSGGPDEQGNMGMWIDPPALKDRWGLAHEFAHALQGSSGGMRDSPYSGWLWESHANWMTHQLPEFRRETHCSAMLVNFPHLYYGSTRDRYCNWQFWEYLKDKHGYGPINAIWSDSPRQGEPGAAEADPFSVLMAHMGWSVSRLNDLFGEWAMHNVTWDYADPDGTDQGAVYRAAYGGYEPQRGERALRTTALDPIDAARRRFSVPFAWAPQRWGYNLVRLHPDRGARFVTVRFRGIVQAQPATSALPGLADEPSVIAMPDSDWRWGLVAVAADGNPRYSGLGRGAAGALRVAVKPDDKGLFLVVVGTPSRMHRIRWDQPWYSIYRYPWMAEFSHALPDGFQKGAPPPVPGARRHANGGGWVAPGASVDPGAYVGPHARVLAGSVRDHARVEDHAVVDGGSLSGNAVAAAMSIVAADTRLRDRARVAATFMPLGAFERGIVLSGTAQNIGDVEQRGASMDHGVLYGFIDQAAAKDPGRGADLTAPVPEVTARPDYRWR